ncbi:MAG: peptide chain release factor 2 [Clostridiales bacterium]|nr:peptide chain release factor 2 [Clostridiales bacterium]
MIPIDDYKIELNKLSESLSNLLAQLDVDALQREKSELESAMANDGFWNDLDNANRVNARVKALSTRLSGLDKLRARQADIETLIELYEDSQDESFGEEIASEMQTFSAQVAALRLELLLKGPYDSRNAVLSLHAGAGGTEAQDWTQMLYRMYARHCERRGWTVRELDMLDGDDAGVKSVTFEVSGENAYGYLKAEKGVHRLVRISPFDAAARRHTSFASLDVTPIFDDDTNEIQIDPDELRVDTYRSSGAGGQHVNKTSSAIRITHLPTGVVVQCQNERSQLQNRETAMRMLKGKLLELQDRAREEQMANIKGEMKKIEWGSQIRSYVFQPYTLVKDHRTGAENGNIQAVMDGDLELFISAYLMRM